jgi:hypothetical protein
VAFSLKVTGDKQEWYHHVLLTEQKLYITWKMREAELTKKRIELAMLCLYRCIFREVSTPETLKLKCRGTRYQRWNFKFLPKEKKNWNWKPDWNKWHFVCIPYEGFTTIQVTVLFGSNLKDRHSYACCYLASERLWWISFVHFYCSVSVCCIIT